MAKHLWDKRPKLVEEEEGFKARRQPWVAARSPSSSQDLCLACPPIEPSAACWTMGIPALPYSWGSETVGEGWHRASHVTEWQDLGKIWEEILTAPTPSGCKGTLPGRRL